MEQIEPIQKHVTTINCAVSPTLTIFITTHEFTSVVMKGGEHSVKGSDELQSWNITEQDFPSKGSHCDKLRFFLKYAILAPSSHNTQPWLFKLADNSIELYADRTRALPIVDPEDRELTMSCGAQLGLKGLKYF